MRLRVKRIGSHFKSIIIAVLLVVGIRTFAFQNFMIPSGSMKETLLIGDFLFVSKYAYGYTNYSFPFSPRIIKGRLFDVPPKRGDVVVFRGPYDHNIDYIKRIVGLPGDTIQMRQGYLYINGIACAVRPDDVFEDQLWLAKGVRTYSEKGRIIPRYIETLPNGVEYKIVKQQKFGDGKLDNTQVYHVPRNHYFVMGDNRDSSSDSRVLSHIGFVPSHHLIGRAEVIFFSTSAKLFDFSNWLSGIRFDRVFKEIY